MVANDPTSDYWREWRPSWTAAFVDVDKACDAFLRNRSGWSLIKYRWDNPDRLLSGPVVDGFWGNVHILLLPEESKFRFSYAVWRDEDLGVSNGIRHTRRSWSNSDEVEKQDIYLGLNQAHVEMIEKFLNYVWMRLPEMTKQQKLREDVIKVPL